MYYSLSNIQAQLDVIAMTPHLVTPDIVVVLSRCEVIIDKVHYGCILSSMDHVFFDRAEQLSERLASTADTFDYPTGPGVFSSVSDFQNALQKFLSWRRGIRDLPRDIQDCMHDITVFIETKHPSRTTITAMMTRGVRLVKRIRRLPCLDFRHLSFADRLMDCITHVKLQSVYRTFVSHNDIETDDLSKELRRLRPLFSESNFADDAEDCFGHFFDSHESLDSLETMDATIHAHDAAANRRRSHLQHGLLVDWLSSNHEQVYQNFLAHVETLVASEQHPSANVTFL